MLDVTSIDSQPVPVMRSQSSHGVDFLAILRGADDENLIGVADPTAHELGDG